MNALLASQLRTAHADITKLRAIVRSQLRSAGLAQDSVGQAMRTIGKGGEVFATDPNDITVQEAALDSLLVRGRRRVLAVRSITSSSDGSSYIMMAPMRPKLCFRVTPLFPIYLLTYLAVQVHQN